TSKHADLTGGFDGPTDCWGDAAALSNNFDLRTNFHAWGETTGSALRRGSAANTTATFNSTNSGTNYEITCSLGAWNANSCTTSGRAFYGNDRVEVRRYKFEAVLTSGPWGAGDYAGIFYRGTASY